MGTSSRAVGRTIFHRPRYSRHDIHSRHASTQRDAELWQQSSAVPRVGPAHAVLVVGNGTNTYLSELLFPSVAKAVVKLKRVPVAIVGADAVRHCGAGERLGEVEQWEGGCVLQARASKPLSLPA